MPSQAWVHRARYVGVSGGKPAEVLAGTQGLERALTRARLQLRRLVVPDENATWAVTAIPAGNPPRARARHRRRRLDLAASLDAPDRCGDRAGDRRPLGGRPARLPRLACAPTGGHDGDEGEGGAARAGRQARRLARRRDHLRVRGDQRGDALARAEGAGRDDPERRRLRRRRRARAASVRPLPDHTHGKLLRPARPATVPAGARRLGARRRRALPRRLPRRRPRVGGRPRARRPVRAPALRAARRVACPATRLGGASAPHPGGRGPWQRRPLGQSVRVRRSRPPDPGSRSAGRRRGRADPRDGRRRRGVRPTTLRRSGRRSRSSTGAGGAADLPDVELSDEWRDRLSRRTRVEEMAAVLRATLD